MKTRLFNIIVVLCEPSHPGNIGAAARAMKTMGLSQLHLVSPNRFPSAEATARASGADDILQSARVFPSLAQAVADASLIYGTSARLRTITVPFDNPRAAATRLLEHAAEPVAVVFGRENAGLTNEELGMCHRLVHVPTVSDYGSLNLAQAVQIVAYECRVLALGGSIPQREREEPPASAARMEGFFDHLDETLRAIHFVDPRQHKSMDQRLRRLFLRAEPSDTEINILRGILARVQQRAGAVGDERRKTKDEGNRGNRDKRQETRSKD